MPEQILSPKETSALLGVTVKTLENWRRTGIYGLPFIRVGGLPRYVRSNVDAWLHTFRVVPQVRIYRISA